MTLTSFAVCITSSITVHCAMRWWMNYETCWNFIWYLNVDSIEIHGHTYNFQRHMRITATPAGKIHLLNCDKRNILL